tara:strand:- start:11230 stop:11565 length:336 start_codon:yes stop_codon:yes gene_type:complete
LSTPEGAVKKKIKAMLNKHGVYSFMPVQNGMGAAALDYHCAVPPAGLALMVEAKAPGKKATLRQEVTMQQMESAGARTIVIDGDNMDELEELIATMVLLGEQIVDEEVDKS